jgi:hypothetical protein
MGPRHVGQQSSVVAGGKEKADTAISFWAIFPLLDQFFILSFFCILFVSYRKLFTCSVPKIFQDSPSY